MTAPERRRLYPAGRDTHHAVASKAVEARTLPDVLRQRASEQPDQIAYRFLTGDGDADRTLSHRQLDRRAATIASALRVRKAAGQRVILAYPPGLDFIAAWFGCAYAGAVAVTLAPPLAGRLARFAATAAPITADAESVLGLTTGELQRGFDGAFSDLGVQEWLGTDRLAEDHDDHRWGHHPMPDDLAMLQYTSGSTRRPRGVMVTHANLMESLRAIREVFWHPSDRGSVCWLPPNHDMGLIGGILAPLQFGLPATIMSPLLFAQHPFRWLDAISRFEGSVSGGPNFAYDLCIRRITDEQRDALDLSGWRVAFNGAEPISAATLDRFADRFAPCGFRPESFTACYGLAEATLLVSTTPDGQRPRVEEREGSAPVVSCGRPAFPINIVDPASNVIVPDRTIGEIWVTGPGVSHGYWNQPAETASAFGHRLGADDLQPFLRTGDQGFLQDGELFVTGRIKDLIIVGGCNLHPHDIERTVIESHPALHASGCAAFAVAGAGGEGVVVLATLRAHSPAEVDAVRRAVRTAVSRRHDVWISDLVLLRRGRLPRTTSGKIQRGACREAYLAGTLDAWDIP